MLSLEKSGLTPLGLIKRSWKSIQDDDIFTWSAALSYYFMLALFPLLLFLLSLVGMLAGAGDQFRASLLQMLARLVPPSAAALIQTTVKEVTKHSSGWKLALGLAAALWSAASGVTAAMDALNVAYHVKETRGWIRKHLVALGLTVVDSLILIISIGLVLYGGKIADWVSANLGMGEAFRIAWLVVEWPVVIALALVGYSLTFYFAPNLEKPKWAWVTPGAVVGFVLWIVASIGFRVYLHFFNSYSATYGSVGAVIILMLWLYLTGAAILVGGEFNSEIALAEVEEEEKRKRRRSGTRKTGRRIATEAGCSRRRRSDDRCPSARCARSG